MAKLAVLDSSAILAVIFDEPGSDSVVPVMKGALLSTVSLAETHAKLLLRGVNADFAWRRLLGLGCRTCFFDDEQARLAAELIGQTRPHVLSLDDRACLALATQRRAAVYTTDSAWKDLGLGIEVNVIR